MTKLHELIKDFHRYDEDLRRVVEWDFIPMASRMHYYKVRIENRASYHQRLHVLETTGDCDWHRYEASKVKYDHYSKKK